VRPEYVEIVEPHTLQAWKGPLAPALVVLAAHVGKTRLIDNRVLQFQGDSVREVTLHEVLEGEETG
jgi:pantothenate synthetase